MSLNRTPINITLLVVLLSILIYLPLGDKSLSHAHSKKNTNELNTLIDDIQNNISTLQQTLDLEKATIEENKRKLDELNENKPDPSAIGDVQRKLFLIEETLDSTKTSLESLQKTVGQHDVTTQGITEQLKTVDESIKRAQALLNQDRIDIKKGIASLKVLRDDLESVSRDVRSNGSDTGKQKSLIEDNSTRIYEILIKLVKTEQKVDELAQQVEDQAADEDEELTAADIIQELNKVWEILNIILIFFIPLAFSYAYTGQDRLKDGVTISDGMILSLFGAFAGYITIGFGVMYGTTMNGFFGFSSPFLSTILTETPLSEQARLGEFMLFQVGTTILATLIIYSAIAGQLSSVNHMVLTIITSAIFIPIFAHWVLADRYIDGNLGWLQSFGFKDEAGTTPFNMVAAFFALTLLYIFRKREPNEFTSSDVSVYSSSSIILLFIGWIGFTTGHFSINDDRIIIIVLNVASAGVSSSIVSLVQRLFFSHEKNRVTYALGGFVSGLVAIAACAQTVTLVEAIVIGAIAGSFHNIGFSFLRKSLFKEPWQKRGVHLVAIHGFSSIWGIMALAIFGSDESFGILDPILLITQLQIIGIALAYSVVAGGIASIFIGADEKEDEDGDESSKTTEDTKNLKEAKAAKGNL